ncbi:MAG: hypothetical protein Q8Q42_03340, partial [Nanoarchaeota archaeon]|nr:hypothetical protein [Nanoarchaeota archaeon]
TDSRKEQFAEGTITLGDASIDITLFTIDDFIPNGFNLDKDDFEITAQSQIDANVSGTITIKAKIPEDLNAVNSEFEEVAFPVGTLKIKGNSDANPTGEVAQFTVYMQRENKLLIEDLDALINDKDTENNLEDGDEIKDLRPGDSVELTIKVESSYETKADIDVEDVEVNILCENDDDLDFEDDNIDFGDIGPGDNDEDIINFDVENDAQEDTATCVVTLEGVDQNGAQHGESLTIDISIDRQTHDIVIDAVALNPTALTCDDSEFQVVVDMINLGTKDEDQVAVQIQSLTLGVNEKLTNLQIDEDDSSSETFIVNVNPSSLEEGKYALLVSTFYDNAKQSDSTVVQIDNICDAMSDSEEEDNELPQTFVNSITLDQSEVSAQKNKQSSVKVQLNNKGTAPVDYTISLENIADFGTSGSSSTIHLNPGQTSTVFLNFKVNDDAEEGMYTATVVLKDAKSNNILETETFTVNVVGKSDAGTPLFSGLNFGGESKILLIVANVVLVIIAIFLIRLIFSSGKKRNKKVADKKLADFEPDHSVVMNKKRK